MTMNKGEYSSISTQKKYHRRKQVGMVYRLHTRFNAKLNDYVRNYLQTQANLLVACRNIIIAAVSLPCMRSPLRTLTAPGVSKAPLRPLA
jgi:hypothetical protein